MHTYSLSQNCQFLGAVYGEIYASVISLKADTKINFNPSVYYIFWVLHTPEYCLHMDGATLQLLVVDPEKAIKINGNPDLSL